MTYSVWDNKTDELVILDGTAKECAEAMGVTANAFYQQRCKAKFGKKSRWKIVSRVEEVEEEDGET